jgi:hypothetical protein
MRERRPSTPGGPAAPPLRPASGGKAWAPAAPPASAARRARAAATARSFAAAILITALTAASLIAFGVPLHGPLAAAFAVVAAARGAAGLAASLRVPAPALMIAAGAALRNTPVWGGRRALDGLFVDHRAAAAAARAAPSAVVFLLAGLEVDPALFAVAHPWCLLAASSVDAVAVAVGAGVAFRLPAARAAALGAVAKAAAPSLLVPLAASLAVSGRGSRSRLPETLVAASALDEASSLALYSFLFGASAPPLGARAVHPLVSGCITLGLGAGAGAGAGLGLWAATPLLRRSPRALAAAAALTALAVKGGLDAAGHVAAGDLAAVAAGFCLKRLWSRGAARAGGVAAPAAARPRATLPPATIAAVQAALTAAWLSVGAPCLLGLCGASVDARRVEWRTVAAAAAIVAGGTVARSGTVLALGVTAGRLTRGEAGVAAAAWPARSTLQIALAGAALAAADRLPASALGRADAERQGHAWQAVCLAAVGLCSAAPALAARWAAAAWLPPDAPPSNEATDDAEAGAHGGDDDRAALLEVVEAALERAPADGADADALRAARDALAPPAASSPSRLLGGDDFRREVAAARAARAAARAAAERDRGASLSAVGPTRRVFSVTAEPRRGASVDG